VAQRWSEGRSSRETRQSKKPQHSVKIFGTVDGFANQCKEHLTELTERVGRDRAVVPHVDQGHGDLSSHSVTLGSGVLHSPTSAGSDPTQSGDNVQLRAEYPTLYEWHVAERAGFTLTTGYANTLAVHPCR
jgi:hypothetical protein